MAGPREKPIIGIDLGTTNACVAHVRSRIPRVVPTDRGNLILPTVVAVSEKGDILVGGVAKDQLTRPTSRRSAVSYWRTATLQPLRFAASSGSSTCSRASARIPAGNSARPRSWRPSGRRALQQADVAP